MKRSEALLKIEFLLLDMLEEGYFGITECEGIEFISLKGDPENRILTFIQEEIGMHPPNKEGYMIPYKSQECLDTLHMTLNNHRWEAE